MKIRTGRLNSSCPQMFLMRPPIIVLGAFILILGFGLMSLGPTLTTASFYKSEAGLFSTQASGSANTTAVLAQMYQDEVNAVNLVEIIVLVGALLAPIGGAVLAFGLATTKRKDDGTHIEPSATPAT